LHGGDIKNVFTTIKYGIQGKGMKSWQQELSASEMAKVANYIMSLQGTQPANAKAAEGDLYIENPASASDSTITKDSTTVVK
jgi:cytochrome c oxidase cbb3-type subunit 3